MNESTIFSAAMLVLISVIAYAVLNAAQATVYLQAALGR